MTRPALEVADVFRRHGEAFRERFGPDPLPGRRARSPQLGSSLPATRASQSRR